MSQSKFVGVDGCPCGWFSVAFSGDDAYELKAFFLFEDLLEYYKTAERILVDIPIGMTDGPEERPCDPEARSKLSVLLKRSVFRVPTRTAVDYLARHPGSKDRAKEVERGITGQSNPKNAKSLSAQTLAIMPKISEVDRAILKLSTDERRKVREIHPEICFWALNGEVAMVHTKHTDEGIEERIQTLCKKGVEPRTRKILDEAWSTYQDHCVGKDDILDALAGAVTARAGGSNNLQTLPANRQPDYKGLGMEMVFWKP